MLYRDRRVPFGVVAVLCVVAVLGFLLGHGRSHGATTERPGTVSTANVVLDYPSDWGLTGTAAAVPQLPIGHAIALAPKGEAADAGLLVGALPRAEMSPLPSRFVARLRTLPDTEVVNLQEVQAYRYERLSIPGFDRELTLFVIPNPHGDPTVLACYAAKGYSAALRACERIVGMLTLTGQPQTYDLTPEADYARRVSSSLATLDRVRVAVRHELRPQTSPTAVRALATRLAGGFAEAAASLTSLEPSSAIGQTQAVLSSSMLQARDAYTALAAAAAAESASDYAAAGRRIGDAESNVDWALENFALLGYGPEQKPPSSSSS